MHIAHEHTFMHTLRGVHAVRVKHAA